MSSKGVKFKNKNNEYIYPCPFYPIGSIYVSTSSTNPSTYFGGTWTLIHKNVIDTGWQSFSWSNSSYIGTTQSSYTQNKWRIKNNILYIHVGAGATSTINTSTETEIARIPVKGNTSFNASAKRIWIGAIGGSGTFGGMMVQQQSSYISVYIKPHTSSNGTTAPWFSTHFTIPLDDAFTFASGSYTTEYKYRRTK